MTSEYFDLVGGYKLPAIGLGTYAVRHKCNNLKIVFKHLYRLQMRKS